MERTLLCILVLSGVFPPRDTSSLRKRLFNFVDEPKAWADARQHCRDRHTDLAAVNDEEDLGKLSGLIAGDVPRAFLGLYRTWGWTLTDDDDHKEGEEAYWNWGSGEQLKKELHCGSVGEAGQWFATNCSVSLNFTCYDASKTAPSERFSLGPDARNWRDAQSYCRGRYTGLARVRNRAENEQLQKMARGDRVWIGLSGTDWAWSDGAQPSFTPWRPRGPSAAGALGDCAVLVLDSKPLAMSDGDCAEKLPFFCYNDPMRKVLLRLELSADPYADMRAPDVMDSIMKWVEKKLSDKGVTEDVKLSWWKLPEKETKPEEEETEPMELVCFP
ncbi:putative C-type lectin domain family 20 member A [Gasterosteus aculeatus]